jgi:flagellin-like hook-associated protein FlgL
MAAGLNALLSTNMDLSNVQDRLNSGKKISSYADNPALFIKAQQYNDKADALTGVNGNISQGLKNLDNVNKAIDTMYKNMDGTLSALKDARTKVVNVVTQVRTAGGTGTGITFQRNVDATVRMGGTSPLTTAESTAARGTSLVGTDITKTNQFQTGDTFAVTLTDSATGSTSTRWFRATTAANVTAGVAVDRLGNMVTSTGATAATAAAAATTDGLTEITALNFNTLGDLSAAINSAFGTDGIQTSLVATKTATAAGAGAQDTFTVGLGLTTASQTMSVGFTQVYNNDPNATGTITSDQVLDSGGKPVNRGASFDFTSILGSFANPTTGAALQQSAASTTVSNLNGQNTALTSGTKALTGFTYAPTANAQGSLASALETRRQATDTYKAALYNYQNMVNDAGLPGFGNLLKGETVSVDLNETGEVKQVMKFGAVDLTTLGFGYTVAADGTVNANNTANNFNNDSDLDNVIRSMTTLLSTLRVRQSAIGAQTSMLQSRLDYNQSMVKGLNAGVTDLTAADSAEEAANLAALTNRQNYALTNLAITKQAEQSLLQLLR